MSKKMEYNEWLSKATNKFGDKYIYDDKTKESFKDSHSKVMIFCKKHGYFSIEARRHINEGYGCNKCAIEYRAKNNMLSLDEFIKKAKLIHGDKYEYIDYLGTKTPSPIICKKHGIFYQNPNDHLSGKGCPLCNESHLEKELKSQLDNLNIKYEYRKHFDWLGKQEIDFFIPKINLGIECQGKQHFRLGGWGNKYDFEKQIFLDEQKNSLMHKNGIQLVYFIDKKVPELNYPEFYKQNKKFTEINEIIEYVKNCYNRIMD